MMYNIKNGATISCSSAFQIESFFKYPFRYVIQLVAPGFRRNKTPEHNAIYCDGWIYEAKASGGVQKHLVEEFFAKLDHSTRIFEQEFKIDLTENQLQIMKNYLEKKVGSKYDFLSTIYAAYDFLKIFSSKKTNSFCTDLIISAYQTIGFACELDPKSYQPLEWNKYLDKSGFMKPRQRLK